MNSITVCTNAIERHSWECWQRHESIWHGTIRLLFRECSPLRTRSFFKRFLCCGFKVLGVVQSTKCVVFKWETACRFSTSVVRSFFLPRYRFCRHPLPRPTMLPFSQTYLIRIFQKPHKDIHFPYAVWFLSLDEDECLKTPPVCDVNANCNNTLGSYLCFCKEGFMGDGKTCQGKLKWW